MGFSTYFIIKLETAIANIVEINQFVEFEEGLDDKENIIRI